MKIDTDDGEIMLVPENAMDRLFLVSLATTRMSGGGDDGKAAAVAILEMDGNTVEGLRVRGCRHNEKVVND